MANLLGKTRDIENPYATFTAFIPDIGTLEIRVLQTHKLPKNEGEYASWFTAGKSDATFGSWEYGDMYKSEIIRMELAYASPEFQEAYRGEVFDFAA